MVSSGSAKVCGAFFLCSQKQGPRTGFGVAGPMSEPFAQYPYGQYGQYPAPEPPKRHRGRTMLGLTATAIVAAGAGAGAAVGLSHGSAPPGRTRRRPRRTALSSAQIASTGRPGPRGRDLHAWLSGRDRHGHRHRADVQRRDPHQQPRDQRRDVGQRHRHRQRQDLHGDRGGLRRVARHRGAAAVRRVRADHRERPGTPPRSASGTAWSRSATRAA